MPLRLCLTHAITHAAHGVDKLVRERLVDLSAQVTYVDIYDVRDCLEALIPHVIQDHGPREDSAGRMHEVFKDRVFLDRKVDSVAIAPHLLSQSIELEVG